MPQRNGFLRAGLKLLVLGCPITCGVLPLMAAAASTPVVLQVSTETAPPGGWVQFKISATAPLLIASGQLTMSFDPTVFGAATQVTVFSSTGDQIGYASPNGPILSVYFSSPSAGIGQLPELPVLVVTVPVLASAKLGATAVMTLDPGAAWTGPDGNQYSVSVTPSTFTVGGGLSIQTVTPGGGLLPAGYGGAANWNRIRSHDHGDDRWRECFTSGVCQSWASQSHPRRRDRTDRQAFPCCELDWHGDRLLLRASQRFRRSRGKASRRFQA